MSKNIFDILVVGSGLSSMIFSEEYLKTKKKIHLISPSFKKKYKDNLLKKINYRSLPPQLKKNFNKIEDYFDYNKIYFNKKNCSLLGSLEFGGLSNYWGLQIDKDINEDLNCFGNKIKNEILECFTEILKEKSLSGKFRNFNNEFKINEFYEKVIKKNEKKFKNLKIEKSIIALNQNGKNIKQLVPDLILKKIRNKIVFHNYCVENITKKKNLIYLHCVNEKQKKVFITKKLVLGAGTLVTTKLLMQFLNINKEVPIKHHPRLISVYLARNKISSSMKFTPGLFQIKSRKKNDIFSGDIRPANKMILDMSLKIYNIFKPLKSLFMLFKNYILFSNNLLGTDFSNLYIKKKGDKFNIYSKNKMTLKILKNKQKKIYNYLRNNQIIFPFFKNFFPGIGADYHYFGTLAVGSKKKLSVNNKCQLHKNKSIYIIDGSVLNFKKNLYPYGYVMANAKRIAKNLKK